jgi:hypothetical protein
MLSLVSVYADIDGRCLCRYENDRLYNDGMDWEEDVGQHTTHTEELWRKNCTGLKVCCCVRVLPLCATVLLHFGTVEQRMIATVFDC